MSNVIDNRIVELGFDNDQFETGVAQSRATLQSFDKSLDQIGDNDGLLNLGKTIKNIDFRELLYTIDEVRSKFSLWDIVAASAIQNLTNRVVNLGLMTAKTFTTDPLTSGLQEYELKMDNIRTTMTNTGSDLETVNNTLDELNTYSDKTIYKFSDMTNALARLTTSGIKDLNLAKTVIQGMANAAAYAGLSNEKLQSIMYNTSQAYSLGYMSLLDWRSLENAGIGNKFKEVVIETAVELGALTKKENGVIAAIDESGKEVEVTVNNMRNTLNEKWLTNDVMTAAFEKYTDESTELGKAATQAATEITTASKLWDTLKEAAQSSWAQNWQIIIGDYEEAKAMWTALNNVISGENGFLTKFFNKQQEVLKSWKELGGRTKMLDSIKNAWEGLLTVLKPIKEAFRDIFPEITNDEIVEFINSIEEFSKKLKVSDETADKIKRTFKGLFALVDILVERYKSMIRVISEYIPEMKDFANSVLDGSASVGDLLVKIRDYIKENSTFYNSTKKIANFVIGLYKSIKEAVIGIIRAIEKLTGIDIKMPHIPTFDEIMAFADSVKEKLKPVTDILNSFSGGLKAVKDKLKEIRETKLDENALSGGVSPKAIAGLAALLILFRKIKEKVDPLSLVFKAIKTGIKMIFNAGDVIDNVGDALNSFVNNVRVDAFFKVAFAIGILTASILVLSLINPENLSQALNSLLGMITAMLILIKALSIMNSKSGFGFQAASITLGLLLIAMAAFKMAKALKIISEIPSDKLLDSLFSIAGAIFILIKALEAINVLKITGGLQSARAVSTLALGMILLSVALKILASIDIWGIIRGLVAIAGSLFFFVVALNAISAAGGQMVAASFSILLISAAMVLLSVAIAALGMLPFSVVAQGIGVIAASLIVFGVAGALITPAISLNLLLMAAAIAALGLAFTIMVPSLLALGSIDFDTFSTALLVLATAIGGFAAAAAMLTPVEPVMITLAAALDLFAAAIWLVADGIEKTSNGFLNFVEGIERLVKVKDNMVGVGDLLASALKEIKQALRGSLKGYEDIGYEIVTYLKDGVLGRVTELKKLGRTINKITREGAEEYHHLWDVLGGNVAIGYANGITENTSYVENAARNMVLAAVRTANQTQKSKSPSRVFMKSGGYAAEGYANGISDSTSKVKTASENMVTSAISAAKTASELIGNLLENDNAPVIRPVIDLNNVYGALDSLSTGEISKSISLGNARAIRTESSSAFKDTSSKLQNGTNNFTFTIYGAEGQNVNELADIVMTKIENAYAIKAGVFK